MFFSKPMSPVMQSCYL